MKVLALDISTRTGWALFEDQKLSTFGRFTLPKTVEEYASYPESYVLAANAMRSQIVQLVLETRPDKVVIEETNKGKNRYTQKILEFIHYSVIYALRLDPDAPFVMDVHYINTMDWRKTLGLVVSKEDKKRNAKLSRAKSKAKATGSKLDKKALGIRGRVTMKHVAVNYANTQFNLSLKQKDNDAADAICLGWAFLHGAPLCDGRE